MRIVNLKIFSNDVELIDAVNEVLFEVHHDFKEANIAIKIENQSTAANEIYINSKLVSLDCDCKEHQNECQCGPIDKIRKALFKEVNWQESDCSCGGNCGCH